MGDHKAAAWNSGLDDWLRLRRAVQGLHVIYIIPQSDSNKLALEAEELQTRKVVTKEKCMIRCNTLTSELLQCFLPLTEICFEIAFWEGEDFNSADPGGNLKAVNREVGDRRDREFLAGRVAGARALKRAGFQGDPAVLRAETGEPIWPQGFSGSISHCYCGRRKDSGVQVVAACAPASVALSLGVDVEFARRRLGEGVERRVATESEFAALPVSDRDSALLSLVSAKESLYKMLFPLCRTFIGFRDVELSWSATRECYRARLKKDLGTKLESGKEFSVYVFSDGRLLISCCVLRSEHLL